MAILTGTRQMILGIVMVVVGVIFFIRHFADVTFGEVWHFLWPLILVAAGVVLLTTLKRK
jgi:uncharacterized membrane protein HdeD (DUF308 family)